MRRFLRSLGPAFGVLFLSPAGFADGILFDEAELVMKLDQSSFPNPLGVAFDGTHYWSHRLCGSCDPNLDQFDENGTWLQDFATDTEAFSIFSDSSNTVYLVGNNSDGRGIRLYRLDDGVPTLLQVLSSAPATHMEFGLRESNNTLYGHVNGTVYLYDFTTGVETGTITLRAYRQSYPANSQLAVLEDYLLTVDGAGNIEAWDDEGNKRGRCVTGLDRDSHLHSFSFADGLVWIWTDNEDDDRTHGYDIGLCEDRADWSSYGAGFPGTTGIPTLTSSADPVLGSSFNVDVGNSLGSQTGGIMFVGLQSDSITGSWGGELLVKPFFRTFVSVPASGLSLPATLPRSGDLCGLHLYVQVLQLDPGAAQGISNTAGLDLKLGLN